jgi:hypothetical protein
MTLTSAFAVGISFVSGIAALFVALRETERKAGSFWIYMTFIIIAATMIGLGIRALRAS